LIFHPVSNCFIDDVNRVWKECFRVLKRGERCSPDLLILSFLYSIWSNGKKSKARGKVQHSIFRHEQLPADQLESRIKASETLEFGHSLEDQIGGQTAAGFVIAGFYEDTAGGDLLDTHINTMIATKAVKL
jgi:hypothetical protein